MIKTFFFKTYALVAYALGILSLIAFILFANNSFVDIALWTGDALWSALAIDIVGPDYNGNAYVHNLTLVAIFGAQHSIMARPSFKAYWTKLVPPEIERSTYVLFTSVALFALVLLWQPIPDIIWQLDDGFLYILVSAIYWLGWIISFAATQMIDGAHLMGLRQAFRTGDPSSSVKSFVTPAFYKLVRHPIQTGILIAMIATPEMTVGRAVLAMSMIVYILIGLYFEERDLLKEFGEQYQDYRNRVAALLPNPFKGR